jgi:hypothetical protein
MLFLSVACDPKDSTIINRSLLKCWLQENANTIASNGLVLRPTDLDAWEVCEAPAESESSSASESPPLLPSPVDPAATPEQFAIFTAKSLREGQRILDLPLDMAHEHFGRILSAKASVLNSQVGAQLKADETALKAADLGDNYLKEIAAAFDKAVAANAAEEAAEAAKYAARGGDYDAWRASRFGSPPSSSPSSSRPAASIIAHEPLPVENTATPPLPQATPPLPQATPPLGHDKSDTTQGCPIRAKVLELHGYGYSQRAIAEALGISKGEVWRVINGQIMANMDSATPQLPQATPPLPTSGDKALADLQRIEENRGLAERHDASQRQFAGKLNPNYE